MARANEANERSCVEDVRKISSLLNELRKTDDTALTVAVGGMEVASRRALIDQLGVLEKQLKRSTPNSRSEKKAKNSELSKEADASIMLARLREWLNSIRNESVKIQTCYPNAKALLREEPTMENYKTLFEGLASMAESLGTLRTAVDYKQAEIVNQMLDEGMDRSHLARELQCDLGFIQRIMRFYNFCQTYPALRYAPYAYNTILQHKTKIEATARGDPDFDSKLRTLLHPRFEDCRAANPQMGGPLSVMVQSAGLHGRRMVDQAKMEVDSGN